MTYNTFIGVDIAKDSFVAAIHGHKQAMTFDNNKKGFQKFFSHFKLSTRSPFIVVECTGGYEIAFLNFLLGKKVPAHRGHPSKTASFLKSIRSYGKTDDMDAIGLARYGAERHHELSLYEPPTPVAKSLIDLSRRRSELVQLRAAEKTRLKSPDLKLIAQSVKRMIDHYTKEIEVLDKQINKIVDTSEELAQKKFTLTNIPGIGDTSASKLLAYLPELGSLDKRAIASLAGVAPHPHQSGKHDGYRSTRGGRREIKPLLFICAMAASRGNHSLGDFHRKLVKNGKKPIVALTALMRKIITIANAKIRDQMALQN